jgi:GDPmannose 4,6-dehydratase
LVAQLHAGTLPRVAAGGPSYERPEEGRRRALITGISGQDGSLLAELLVGEGYDVAGVVRGELDAELPNLAAVREHISLVPGDLARPRSLRDAVHAVLPHELYHLAAPTFVPASWEHPLDTLTAVAGATAALLEIARALEHPPRVWVAASSEVFGDAGVSPQGEDAPMRPRSPYGVAKLAALRLVGAYRERYGLHASAGITFNHESPRRPPHFLPRKVTRGVAAIKLGLQSELVLGGLDAVRDWCAAEDVVRGAWLAVRHDEPGDYVLAGGVGRTVRELVEVAFAHVGLRAERFVRVDPRLVRPVEETPPVGDPTRAREVLGWQPRVGFEELVGRMVDADLALLQAATPS